MCVRRTAWPYSVSILVKIRCLFFLHGPSEDEDLAVGGVTHLGLLILYELWAGRLRHLGWEGSGHGLTSRPRETSSRVMLDELLFLLGYPLHSGDALLGTLLPQRYCKRRLGVSVPSWMAACPQCCQWACIYRVGGCRARGSPGVPQRLRLLALCLEELEAFEWEVLEVSGRESTALPGKLQAPRFPQDLERCYTQLEISQLQDFWGGFQCG